MTTNQTNDGVLASRELLEVFAGPRNNTPEQMRKAMDELRALLDAESAPCAKSQVEGKRERFQKWVMATKHPVFGFLDGRSLARGDDRTGYADEYVQGLWVAYLEFGSSQPAPVALNIPDECPHLIVFDDTDREQIMFAGAGALEAALKTWEKISGSWNAHLFVRVERNSRDDRYPSAGFVPATQPQGKPVAWRCVAAINGKHYITEESPDQQQERIDKSEPGAYLFASEPLYLGQLEQPAPVAAVQKYDDTLLPFVALMRKELHANAVKGDRPGWLSMSADTCMLEIIYHFGKLQKAVRKGGGDSMSEYAADVANLCMMLLDICGALAFVDLAAPVDKS